jgi:hypothetical protein
MARSKRKVGAELGTFMRQYRRKRPKGMKEPNDRQYDRKLEERIKRMKPEQLDELLRGETETEPG